MDLCRQPTRKHYENTGSTQENTRQFAHAPLFTPHTQLTCPGYPSYTPHMPLTVGVMHMRGARDARGGVYARYVDHRMAICRQTTRKHMEIQEKTRQLVHATMCTPRIPLTRPCAHSHAPHIPLDICAMRVRGVYLACYGYVRGMRDMPRAYADKRQDNT